MTPVLLYRYFRDNGETVVSPIKPDCEYEETYRWIPDEGFILTDGKDFAPSIDADKPGKWYEIEFTPETNEEATEEDYQNALTEFGVEL